VLTSKFNYNDAFSINLGLFSVPQQQKLRDTRVTIAGTGGAGGVIAIMLARSGIARFTLIDFDTYSITNLNRQIGCFIDTIGMYKAEVIKKEILRINPEAGVTAVNRILSLEELDTVLDNTDVYFSEADDLAYSTHSLIMAQQKNLLGISYMPMGMAGYIMVFPPGQSKIYDPTDMFGGPAGLDYDALKGFQDNPVNRSGRRWHITQGKMRIEWFNKWRRGETTLTQLCPSVWIGASLACIEAIKFITGKAKTIEPPKMWQIELAENRIKVKRFRKRTWLFSKYIFWVFNTQKLGIGRVLQKNTLKALENDLARMEKEEAAGKKPRLPFLWKHVI